MNNTTLTIEERILTLHNEGLTQRDIAQKLFISRDKVRYSLKKNRVGTLLRSINCKQCGSPFETKKRSAKFCGDYCRLKYNKATILLKTNECKGCGKPFTTYKSKFCSDECRHYKEKAFNQLKILNKARRLYVKSCSTCRDKMVCRQSNRMYCLLCRKARNKAVAIVNHTIKCKECGRHKEVSFKRKSFCTNECSKRFESRVKETKRRKKIISNGRIDNDISIERLIKRDKFNCYLCNERVNSNDFIINDKGYYIAGDYYPSIEHVKPVAKGGTHTWDNVKLAHRKCNWEKGIETIE